MRIERLILETSELSYALDFHPRLTVIAGLGGRDRDGLIGELVGALGGGAEGAHLELVSDTGSRFAVLRPLGGSPRIISVDAGLDVTDRFCDGGGGLNLLGDAGLEVATARRVLAIDAAALAAGDDDAPLIRHLATAEQRELWISAEILRSASVRLREENDAYEGRRDDDADLERIEQLREVHVARRDRFERVRRLTAMIAGAAGLITVPGLMFLGLWAVVPSAALTVLSALATLVTWRLTAASEQAESRALAKFGAQSYLGFQLQRVNGLFGSDQARRDLMWAAENHRSAAQRWERVSGGEDLSWVFTRRDRIAAAARVGSEVFGDGSGLLRGTLEHAIGLAENLIERLAGLRSVGLSEENYTAILDEPFVRLDPSAMPSLLELLVRSSEHQQIVLLTEDTDIAEWARVEAMAGTLLLIEPIPTEPEQRPATGAVATSD